jgi:methylenetetrahydrofolate dehydrogenase (NADP+)/methenyltetrahydrofolate cyclohydrolase
MTARLLEGKPIAEKIKTAVAAEVSALKTKYRKAPRLVAVQAGSNASSEIYVKAQQKAAEALGIEYELKTYPDSATQKEMEAAVKGLNKDDSVSAVILQLPVPKGIDGKSLVNMIAPDKDAEGMHPENLGKILLGQYRIAPCTAMAVMELLDEAGVKLYGKEVVVVGHSEIVGKPLALMLLNKFATTTVCHIATGERGALPEHVKRAEVLIVAVGKAGVIKGDWIKEGAVVIDVGINRVGQKTVGDVECEAASARASYITPVPGGVGPLTTTMLMRNTLEQFKARL